MKKKIFLTLLLIITLGFITFKVAIPVEGTSEWTLTIDGAVSYPTVLTLNELMAMSNSTVYAEIYCYGVFVTGGNWTGVSLSFLLETVELDQNAISAGFYATDGYGKELSLTDVLGEDVIIAYELNAHPLSETLRLVLPSVNGELWVAMINHITVRTTSVPPIQSATSTGPNLMPSPQQSSTPQPTSTPTSTPAPTPTPQPTPSSVTPSPSLPPTDSDPEPFPLTWAVIAVAALVVGGTGVTVYFKKRNQ